jgi:hypothetical protein
MGFKLLNDLNVVERFELLERLERFELLEPPDHRLRFTRQSSRTGVLGERDQARPNEIVELIYPTTCSLMAKKLETRDRIRHTSVISSVLHRYFQRTFASWTWARQDASGAGCC